MFWILPLLALLLPGALNAQAPVRAEPVFHSLEWRPTFEFTGSPVLAASEVETRDVALTALGSTAALGVVFVASVIVFAQGGTATGPDRAAAQRGLVLFLVGGSVVTPLGAHLANRRRGSLPVGILATAAAMAGSVAYVASVERPEAIFIPAALLGTATMAELLTTR